MKLEKKRKRIGLSKEAWKKKKEIFVLGDKFYGKRKGLQKL